MITPTPHTMLHLSFTQWGRLQEDFHPEGEGRMLSTFDLAHRSPSVQNNGGYADDDTALRWRNAVLRLSDHFTSAAAAHPNLAGVLIDALGNALEQLLLFSRERDLCLLEQWLDEEQKNSN